MQLLNKQIIVKLSGGKFFEGILTDIGVDILVLFDGQRFIYIPLLHVHKIRLSDNINGEIDQPIEFSLAEQIESISYRSILTNSKGRLTEIRVVGDQSLHGYITNVLNDYLVFYTPVYKTMLISLNHLKWLTLYNSNVTPYTPYTLNLNIDSLPTKLSNTSLQHSLEKQLKEVEGNLVVFDMGKDPDKIGLLKKVENNLIELVIENGETMYLKLTHIKSVHVP
ncbi:DUF2642 domain-containing protein [Bacillus sp. OTU530]|uniref:DUF2642 domain-containing protein n=1 Tax=Bacillus sp. OTU530 TaxID=3043862 RepID=UPI00313AEC75